MLIFHAGLTRLLPSGWLALGAASCLLYSNLVLIHVHYLMSDVLASALAIAALGFLCWVVAAPGRWWPWVGVTACVLGAWQVRPAYLFLVPLVPLLGVLLAGVARPRPEWSARSLHLGAGLALAAVLPLLAYCALRAAVVGNFAVASATGINLLGVVGPHLTPEVLPELPEGVRPKVEKALAAAKNLPPLPPPHHEAWDRSVLQTMVLERWDTSEWYQGLLQYLSGVQQEVVYEHNLHNRIVFVLFVPLVTEEMTPEEHATKGELALDRRLGEIAWAVLKARPAEYLAWVGRGLRQAGILLLTNNLLLGVLALALAALTVAERGRAVWVRLRTGQDVPITPGNYAVERNVLLLLAVAFAVTKSLQLVLVVPPVARYVDAAGVFLPLPVMLAIVEAGARLRPRGSK